MWRWILAVLALLASLWLGNLAMFNWWAAGGPPTVNRAGYELRGNIFFALALVAVALCVALVVQAIRRRGRRDTQDPSVSMGPEASQNPPRPNDR